MTYGRPGYTDIYRQQHEAEQREAAQAESDRKAANEEAGRLHRAKVDAERADRRRIDDEAVEASLAPDRQREQRRWLAEHPDKTEADFTRHAWPQIRLNFLEGREEAMREETRQSLLRSGRFTSL